MFRRKLLRNGRRKGIRKLTAKWIISYRDEGVAEIIRFDGLGQIIYGVSVGLPRNKYKSNMKYL